MTSSPRNDDVITESEEGTYPQEVDETYKWDTYDSV